ncbi:MAG: tetratricopeptide repeat protein [Termitinemataceae bacterium]|nr:MAG: tetratricopeptide repeat protein [Termitinemataceae bacterium]
MRSNFLSLAIISCSLFLSSQPIFSQDKLDALAEYRKENWASAVNICKTEIAQNPQNLDSHVVLCWSLLKLGLYDEARNFALAAQGLSRYDVRVIEILGETAYYQGRNKEALQYFEEYISLAPEGQRLDMAFYFEGEIYIRLSRFRHADIALTTALHYVPKNAKWWSRLGWARENAGDLLDSIVAYERALALDPALNDAKRGLERVRSVL